MNRSKNINWTNVYSRWPGKGVIDYNNNDRMFYSGLTNVQHKFGIGFLMANIIIHVVIDFEAIN